MVRLAVILITALLLLPASGPAAGGLSFAFGRTGGNIEPFTVTISSTGAVKAVGPVRPTLSLVRAGGLARLAALVKTTRFSAMPRATRCAGTLPDFAASFVTVKSGAGSRTVLVRGDCNPAFSALYTALAAAAGIRQ